MLEKSMVGNYFQRFKFSAEDQVLNTMMSHTSGRIRFQISTSLSDWSFNLKCSILRTLFTQNVIPVGSNRVFVNW